MEKALQDNQTALSAQRQAADTADIHSHDKPLPMQ
jgi:hypothetical protein